MIATKVLGYGLLASLLLNAGLGVSLYAQRASTKMQEAKVRPLEAKVESLQRELTAAEGKSEGFRTALQQCEDSKVRVADQNTKAAADAAAAAAEATAAAEDFLKRLASQPAGCEAILKAKVCPALMDY